MDETAWLNATDPQVMLTFLRDAGRTSDRKLRLFALTTCVRVVHLVVGLDGNRLLLLAEQCAEAAAEPEQVREADALLRWYAAANSVNARGDANQHGEVEASWTFQTLLPPNEQTAWHAAWHNAMYAIMALHYSQEDVTEGRSQAALLRDIVGNPFAPPRPVEAAWLRWNDGTVVRIAQGIYEERAFERMGVLADGLLDAGCDDEKMLQHCRQEEAVHARGCWVIDLLLGKS